LPLNGVDVSTLFATINEVKDQPQLGEFQFRVSNRWIEGTNSRSRIESFTGAGGEHSHKNTFEYDSDHPEVLVGRDRGPAPVEFVLLGLAACLTAGIGNIAAARGIKLTEVDSTIEGNIDLRGVLGISEEVRNGYRNIRVNFRIKGDAPPEKLRQVVEQSRARSAVFDIVTNGVPVYIEVDAG
jgi:uncharacterized OsmC-like protein